jgi:hypothetical protein
MLNWFDCISIAATIAIIIAALNVEFPLQQFVQVLCESTRTGPFVYLFLELRFHGAVTYADF